MANTILNLIDLTVFALSLHVILGAVFNTGGLRRLGGNLIFLASMLLGWQFMVILLNLSRSEWWVILFHHLELPFIAFSVVALFLYVLRFYSLDVYHTSVVILILSVIPMMTTILALTGHSHEYLREGIQIQSYSPYPVVASGYGMWFWVHTIYSYALIAATALVAVSQYRSIPQMYRTPSKWLIGGILVAVVGNVLVLLRMTPARMDFSLIGSSVCVTLLYYSTRNTQGLDFLNHVRGEVFNEIHKAIFVLDDENNIINLNHTAKQMLARTGVRIGSAKEDKCYDVIIERVLEGAVREQNEEAEASSVDYYFPRYMRESVFNVQDRDILDRQGRRIGGIAICSEVTENRSVIRKLEVDSGIDAMTGLLNRYRLSQVLLELDQEEHLPLTVMMVDLNNLKQINDSRGHWQGDLVIRATAEGLSNCCPAESRLARIGGDEFLALIPSCSIEQAQELAEQLERYFDLQNDGEITISLAIGTCVRENMGQTVQSVIDGADTLMYIDKRKKKAHQEHHKGRTIQAAAW